MRSYTSKGRRQNTDVPRLEFEIDGVTFTGDGSVSVMDLSEFARLATLGTDTQDPRAGAIIADIYHALLGESEYQRFRAHCRKHGTDGETLLSIIGDLAAEESEEKTGRPTGRSSDSSDGPPNAPATVTVVSFSKATVEEKPVEETPPVVSYG
ncbi:hypothetical protein ACBJ59_10580 [Nonomuraea sp. MTCD27]|uniref:hypothetical protein n=1 Tax=Nonomuraea sp. MTCD27 TaxID=1676747 RepID=UPI0035BF5696